MLEQQTKLNILFISSAQDWYIRNKYIDRLFRKSGYQVTNIISSKKNYLARSFDVLVKLVFLKNKKTYNHVVIGFLAQILIPFVRFYFSKNKITADYFVSIYDTICCERKKIDPNSITGKLIYKFEEFTLKQTKKIFVDTKSHKKYFVDNYNYPEKNIRVIYTLPDLKIFFPRATQTNSPTKIFYYGSGLNLHGFAIILKAIKLIQDENLHFTLIGPFYKNEKKLINKLKIKNNVIDFIPWIDHQQLPDYIAGADICLAGHFGLNEKAKRVIPGKAFQFAAMKKAIILGDNPANKEIFTNKKNSLMVTMGDPTQLSEAISFLSINSALREKIGKNVYELIKKLNCVSINL